MFGIHDHYNSQKTLNDVKAKLDGVDYIFLDEVSMLSCRDIYKISAQLAKAMNVYDKPFGGLNFIFAGDFAQLPPAGATPLYGCVKTKGDSRMKVSQQESAIGKALWHQVTTVVILWKNMRQKNQSDADTKLYTCLENMRYKVCTQADIDFLKTRVVNKSNKYLNLASSQFRNVSIITGWNAQKDRLNELGCKRFTKDHNKSLVSFYSIDNWKSESKNWLEDDFLDDIKSGSFFPLQLQRILWNQPHASSDHISGRLDLCIGMPVMIQYNEATECCITRGAEGSVLGWQSFKGCDNKDILETVFVKLSNPPQSVNIPGLPLNVVPIVPRTQSIVCFLPSDQSIEINCTQVSILPNFNMTDYASQG